MVNVWRRQPSARLSSQNLASPTADQAIATGFFEAAAAGDATAVPSGVSASSALGAILATGAAVVLAVGVAASIALGSVTASAAVDANASPGGLAAASSVGAVVASGAATGSPAGIQLTADLGTAVAGVSDSASPAGVAAATALGTVVAHGAAVASPAGCAGTSALGTVRATGSGSGRGTARLVAPGGLLEVRTLAINHLAAGESRVFDLEILALGDVPECRLGRRDSMAALGTVEVSGDAGATWDTVPDAGSGAMTGPDYGPLISGDRKAVKVRLTLPAATPGVVLARSRSIGLVLGFGS